MWYAMVATAIPMSLRQLSLCHSGSQDLSWHPRICTVFLFISCNIEKHKHKIDLCACGAT